MESLLNLKNLSNTRWLARSELIRVVCISFEVIQSTLVDISISNSFDAKNKNASHQSHMETYINRLWYKFDVSEERHAPYAADDRNPSITWVKHHRCYRHHTEHGWVAEKRDCHDTMNQEINPGEFQRKRRMRKAPIRFDPNQETTAKVTLHQFYRGELIKLLNMLI